METAFPTGSAHGQASVVRTDHLVASCCARLDLAIVQYSATTNSDTDLSNLHPNINRVIIDQAWVTYRGTTSGAHCPARHQLLQSHKRNATI